jgi:hypothetical protein
MGSILCLSIAGIIVSTWPHSLFTLSSEPQGASPPSRIEGVWRIDDKRQRLQRLPAREHGTAATNVSPAQGARASKSQGPDQRDGTSVERLTLARSGNGARNWVMYSSGVCSGLESLLETPLAQSGLLDQQAVELSACARTAR